MATVREYVQANLDGFNLDYPKIKMDALLMRVGVADDNVALDDTTLVTAEKAIALAIPELLLRDDVTEGGFSLKRNTAGVTAYYNLLCARNGFVNELSAGQPTVSDASNRW